MIKARLSKLRRELKSRNLDGLIVTDLLNVRYISAFTGSFGVLVVSRTGADLFTDARYGIQSCEQCIGITVHIVDYNWPPHIQKFINDLGMNRVGFEEGSLIYHNWKSISDLLPAEALIPTSGIVEGLRMIKDPGEIARIKEAARIADIVYDEVVVNIRPGMCEADIALEMYCCMRRHGAEKEGFDTIVAAGSRSALPHWKASKRKVETGDLIVFDYGALYEGYHSDITRTLVIGQASPRQQELYDIVLEAQKRAIEAIRPGLRGKEVDAVARDYISSKGCGELFGHGLGHGLGLDIHDPGALSRRGEVVLQPGMVFTVEPGIYIADWGGIRIEDDILVTTAGCEVLTHSPKELCLCK